MPETVEKFRRSFDAAGWVPDADLPVDEKLHRTREIEYDNDHERDALAAALFAVDDHEDQFARIAAKTPPQFERGEVIARVLGDDHSVESALADLRDDDDDDDDETSHEPRELSEAEKRRRRLERRVERLESHVEELEETVAEKDERIEELTDELSEARREERREIRERRTVSRLERNNERLERERDEARETVDELEGKLERLKTLWKLDHSNFADVNADGDLVPVKMIEQFTKDAIARADESFGLAAGDVVYLRDASGAGESTAKRLAATEPRVVLRDGGLSAAADRVLFEREIPVAPADDVTIQEIDELAVARESAVEAAIEDWERRAEERRRDENAAMVDRLISEHRAGDDAATGN
jgi:predicted RNase H-like nuclease (RuvC/YqgF family)